MAEFAATTDVEMTGCPVAHWFKPGDTAAHTDPFPWYQQLRQDGRVVFVADPDNGPGMYVVSHHKEITTILRDPVNYSNAEGLGSFDTAPPEILEEAGEDWRFPLFYTLTLTDPPQHTRLRKLMAPSFTPRRLGAFEDAIRKIVSGRIDGFDQRRSADLAADFAYQIPNRVIARIMGIEEGTAEQFVEWVEAFLRVALTEPSSKAEELHDWRVLREQEQYCRALVEARRRNPEDDLTTDLIRARTNDGEPVLTDDEILCNTLGFIGAGSESTAIMICNTMYLLLSHPEQWEEVTADPELIPTAIEEALRLLGPVRGIIRVAKVDTELAGVPIPKGARLYCNMMSANHDDEVFEEPSKFDIHRPALAEHLGFGKWAHFCIGAPLARLEGRIAISALAERLPSMRLASDSGFGYHDNMVTPPVKALRVEWD